MAPGLFCNDIPNGCVGLLPGVELHILECQEDHRVFPLIVPVILSTRPNLLIPEIDGGVLIALFKERTQHIHVQRLAKTPGPGEQRNHRSGVQKIPDQQGLVHIVVIRGGGFEIRDADGKWLTHRRSRQGRTAPAAALIHWLLRSIRNEPLLAFFICTGDTSISAQFIHPPLRNPPSGRCLFDRHIGIPPSLAFGIL